MQTAEWYDLVFLKFETLTFFKSFFSLLFLILFNCLVTKSINDLSSFNQMQIIQRKMKDT